MQSGSCRRQGECRFAHGYGELRHTAEVYKTSLCTFWEYGNCQYGNFCRHAHGLKELRTVEENRRRFNTTMNESGNSSPSRSTNPPSTAGSDNPEPPQYEPPQYADFKTFAALDCGFANEFSAESSAEFEQNHDDDFGKKKIEVPILVSQLHISRIFSALRPFHLCKIPKMFMPRSNESSTSSPGPIGPAAEPGTRCIPVEEFFLLRGPKVMPKSKTLFEIRSNQQQLFILKFQNFALGPKTANLSRGYTHHP